jgi:TPR repeat protein
MSNRFSRRRSWARTALLGAAVGLIGLSARATTAATPSDGNASEASAPFHGLVELTEYQRFQLAHLPWAGNPDPARLAQLRDAWKAVTVHDDETARGMVEKAAEVGDANAQYLMAGALLDALGPNEHYAEAEALLKKASDQGQPTAAYWLGRIRDLGSYGQPTDKAEALYWYRMADALGHPEAAAQLCWLSGQGIGMTRNAQQALTYSSAPPSAAAPGR